MRRKLGPVQSRDQSQNLLGRIASPVDDDEVLLHRLGQNAAQAQFDLTRAQDEFLTGDDYGASCLCHGFSDLSLQRS